ncbi:hypothetical protein WJX79_001749 [Trebouxia sp. C0005]
MVTRARFGEEVMHTLIEWLHLLLSQHYKNDKSIAMLDVGTGNALLPLQLAKLGYSNLTGSDYSAQSIALSKHILQRHGQTHIQLLEDDLLQTCLTSSFDVITDKGTLDAVGLMQDADINRAKYQQSVWSLLKSNGLLVITSCNSTKDELCEEFCQSTEDGLIDAASCPETDNHAQQKHVHQPHLFQYVDHVRTYPKFKFAGIEGTKVCTVAFRKLQS